jgi:hypothetical protein
VVERCWVPYNRHSPGMAVNQRLAVVLDWGSNQ